MPNLHDLLKLLSFICIIVVCTLSGCYNCDNLYKEEPDLSLSFEDDVNFNRVYALKPGEPDTIPGFNNFIIPIDLNSKSTVYIFEASTKTDTLELLYDIDAELISKDCGFAIELSNVHPGSLTTFDSVIVASENHIVVR